MRSIFGWSYPPGCSGPPDIDDACICGLPLRRHQMFCGPSCERADEEGTVDSDCANFFVDEPFVLATNRSSNPISMEEKLYAS